LVVTSIFMGTAGADRVPVLVNDGLQKWEIGG
jgi:hypothetical protein